MKTPYSLLYSLSTKEVETMSGITNETYGIQDGHYPYQYHFQLAIPHCPHTPSHRVGTVIVKTRHVISKQEDLLMALRSDQVVHSFQNPPIGHQYTFLLKQPSVSKVAFQFLDEGDPVLSDFVSTPLTIKFKSLTGTQTNSQSCSNLILNRKFDKVEKLG